jgi:hypothetical protein
MKAFADRAAKSVGVARLGWPPDVPRATRTVTPARAARSGKTVDIGLMDAGRQHRALRRRGEELAEFRSQRPSEAAVRSRMIEARLRAELSDTEGAGGGQARGYRIPT